MRAGEAKCIHHSHPPPEHSYVNDCPKCLHAFLPQPLANFIPLSVFMELATLEASREWSLTGLVILFGFFHLAHGVLEAHLY